MCQKCPEMYPQNLVELDNTANRCNHMYSITVFKKKYIKNTSCTLGQAFIKNESKMVP